MRKTGRNGWAPPLLAPSALLALISTDEPAVSAPIKEEVLQRSLKFWNLSPCPPHVVSAAVKRASSSGSSAAPAPVSLRSRAGSYFWRHAIIKNIHFSPHILENAIKISAVFLGERPHCRLPSCSAGPSPRCSVNVSVYRGAGRRRPDNHDTW